jgi:hypothetical protein
VAVSGSILDPQDNASYTESPQPRYLVYIGSSPCSHFMKTAAATISRSAMSPKNAAWKVDYSLQLSAAAAAKIMIWHYD